MLGQKARTLIENIPVQIHFFRKVPKDITEVRAASQMYINTHTVRCSHPFLPKATAHGGVISIVGAVLMVLAPTRASCFVGQRTWPTRINMMCESCLLSQVVLFLTELSAYLTVEKSMKVVKHTRTTIRGVDCFLTCVDRHGYQ